MLGVELSPIAVEDLVDCRYASCRRLSVKGESVQGDLFERHWSIQLLHEENILANEPGFRDRGLSRLSEKIYLLKKKLLG